MFDWQRWKHRVVRDLAWVIASPPLASGEYDGVVWWDNAFVLSEYQACLPSLESLDQDPSPLINYLDQQKGKALGHRFEAFVAYWMQISPNFELLHRSVQLHGDGRTLGELDFILRDNRTQKVIHLEVAVKFFMGLDPLNQLNRWYGSNLKDSLDSKINHLITKQTQLSLQQPELLPMAIDQRCCCVKGRLFYPEYDQAGIGPEMVSGDHLRGILGTDVAAYAERMGSDLVAIAKRYWFAEFDVGDFVEEPLSKFQGGPQCYVLLNQGREVGRYFEYPVGYFDSVMSKG
ncbi:DUF1853 family protein [Leucothrix arctica]|uniref:DUF1853 domain-containing protein n=1 Tax=Leucothrix arctica TaxID=1481894 RepID=A0A317CMB8_9GAMM|nr:DUF1853 family protein [Leucothrix arctica]PWQ99367.1 hypothetical protein DKT75_01325 [Leucothrix arctica]